MAVWDDLLAKVYVLTNRPKMVAETESALRLAIRTAHRQGKFWKDATIVEFVSDPALQIQSISIPDNCPRFRQLAFLRVKDSDVQFDEVSAADLLDNDGFARTNVYWGVGTTLNAKLATTYPALEIGYYLQPVTSPSAAVGDWLISDYEDVVVLLAAGTVLGSIGEQDIKARLDTLLAIAIADLISDNLEVTGR